MIRFIQFFTDKYYLRGLPNVLFRIRRLYRRSDRIYKIPGDIKMELNIDNYFDCQIVWGYYEAIVKRIIKSYLKEGDSFLDIGSNIGIISCTAAKQVGQHGKVIAFDPNPDVWATWERNIKLNLIENAVLIKKGASNTHGDIILYQGTQSELSTMVKGADFLNIKKEISVPLTRVDDELVKQNIDISKVSLVKVDVEGHESPCLEGMKTLISLKKACFIIENNVRAQQLMHNSLENLVRTHFCPHGYFIYWLDSKSNKSLFYKKDIFLRPISYDTLAEYNLKNGDFFASPQKINC
jgi:FkbM family methyltransferase